MTGIRKNDMTKSSVYISKVTSVYWKDISHAITISSCASFSYIANDYSKSKTEKKRELEEDEKKKLL